MKAQPIVSHSAEAGGADAARMMVATDPPASAASGGSAESDADALRVWRAACPELRALWDEREPVTAWEGLGFGEAGGADAGRVVEASISLKGLSGDVPAALGGLAVLKELDLSANQLTSIPNELGALKVGWCILKRV